MPQHIMPLDSAEQIRAFNDLDSFTQGYVQSLFFTECHCDNETLEHMTFGDLDPDSLKVIIADCAKFQEKNAADIEAGPGDASQAGHDFWLTRNRHGVGFWAREDNVWPKDARDRMDASAREFGEVWDIDSYFVFSESDEDDAA